MKSRVYSLVQCFVMLVLVLSATPARGQGPGPEGIPPAQAATAADRAFAHFFVVRAESAPTPWWQTSTIVDSSGGVHLAYYTSQSIHYAYCPAGCDDPNNWSETPLAGGGGYDSLFYPALAVDASNRPRMMWYIHPNYFYAECNANCTDAANWTSVQVPVASQYYIYPKTARYFALDSQGRPRFVCYGSAYDSVKEQGYSGFAYTTCDGNCTSASSWLSSLIDLGGTNYVEQPQIELNANDQPRVMGVLTDANSVYRLMYLGCDAGCSQAANWMRIGLYQIGQSGRFAFRLDSQGRARVAFYNDNRSDPVYYAWSNSPVINPNGWVATGLAFPPNDWRTVDLAIDSQDRPRLALASAGQDLEYVECTANCDQKPGAIWQLQHVETTDELDVEDPIPAGACIASTWMMEGYPSLALDAADRPSVSYYARHSKMCMGSDGRYGILYDVSALRFATAGTGSAGPLDHAVYLPLTVR